MIKMYGLKSCDTCRKARTWLAENGVSVEWVDVRTDGLDAQTLARWGDAVGWEALLNRRGTTWRGLADADKADVDAEKAMTLMLTHPALIKRPIFDVGGRIVVGFKGPQKEAILAR